MWIRAFTRALRLGWAPLTLLGLLSISRAFVGNLWLDHAATLVALLTGGCLGYELASSIQYDRLVEFQVQVWETTKTLKRLRRDTPSPN